MAVLALEGLWNRIPEGFAEELTGCSPEALRDSLRRVAAEDRSGAESAQPDEDRGDGGRGTP